MLEQAESAIAVYKKVLEIDGDDIHALDALIKRYLGLSNWADLLGIYTKKADLVADPEEKKRIYYQVGAVYERELGDVPKAIDTYQKILELDPDDLQALSRLDVLYEQAQNWQELLSVLTRESEMTADPAEAISFQYRIADLYEKRLEDVARAIELYRDILSQQADHGPTLQALEGLKSGDKDPLGAAAVLEPVYEAASDWPKLVSVHEVQVAHTEDVFQKVELLHRISRLHEDAMDNHASAFDTYARAVAIDNGNQETLQNLERIATLVNRWPEVAKLYDAELDKLAEAPDRFVELGLRVAQIYETQLENVADAIGRYRRVADVDAENQNAIRALDRLFTQTERWQDLAAILAREAEIGQTPDEILDFRFRLGQLYEQKLSDVDHAIAAYREVIGAAPEHTQTMQALEALFAAGTKQLEIGEILEPLYRAAGDWEKLAKVYEAQLTHTPTTRPESGEGVGGQEDRLAAYYRIAELHEDKLVDAAGALEVYVRALREYPLDERSGDDVARLASVVDGGWDHLANAYADIVGHARSARSATHDRQAPRARVRRRARRHHESRRDVQIRFVGGAARRRRALEPRPHLSLARIVARARASPRATHQGGRGSARARRASRAPRRDLRDEARRQRERDSRVPSHLRRARQDARSGDRRARPHLHRRSKMARAPGRPRARARERIGRRRRSGHPREDRDTPFRSTRPTRARDRNVEGRARSTRRGRRSARRAREPLRAAADSGASSSTCSSVRTKRRPKTTNA